MILCGSENVISGESDRIVRWIVDIFFILSRDKEPPTASNGEETKVVSDSEQYENEFILYSLSTLMRLVRCK